MKPIIGFIGLGIMGRHMSAHLIKAGYDVVVYDLNSEAVTNTVKLGASMADSCADLAKRADVVISMVPDSSDVELVALGGTGLIQAVHPGIIYVDMSTIAPKTAIKVAQALEAKGVRCLDAPVSGGEVGARDAKLSIMVGGAADLLEEVRPILQCMGSTITHCGPSGAGQVVKACNQIQVALNLIGMAEAMVLGAKAGVDPAIILQVLSGGYAQSRVMDVRGPRLIQGDFTPGFKSRFHYKDLNIIMETARAYGVVLPAAALAHQLFNAILVSGRGELDHSAVITVIEDLSKYQARTHTNKKSEDTL